MPAIRHYIVTQTRSVKVRAIPRVNETYEEAALRVAHEGFENPGDFQEGMEENMVTMPAITETKITRVE